MQTLNSFIHVKQNGVRSVQISHDSTNAELVSRYLLTAQCRQSLAQICAAPKDKVLPSHAWTLTGPYGAGKSYFGLFMMNLACSTLPGHKQALIQLQEIDSVLAEQAAEWARLNSSDGLLAIPILGYRTSFLQCLKQGLEDAVKKLPPSENVLRAIRALSDWTPQTDTRQVIRWLQLLLEIVTQPPYHYCGILMVFDEMGKTLEYAAQHPEISDVFLLQELAEFANRSGTKPFIFSGILHQGFDRYAQRLDSATQHEWAKVQGRFEDISFAEPPNQQMWLLSKAIEIDKQLLELDIQSQLDRYASEAIESGWCPPTISPEEFRTLCNQAYPFHPSTLVALPYLFRILEQNERSIFAYLGTLEPLGFQEFLHRAIAPDFLRLWDVFDYLTTNFQSRLYASNRGRALTECLEKLNNTPTLSLLETQALKVVGVLNWMSKNSFVQPTEGLIIAALKNGEGSIEKIRDTLDSLKRRSFIVFRKYNRTYAIWQGSDVDIEERMQEAQKQLSNQFSLAKELQTFLSPRPIVARRHSYEKGTLRFFDACYVDTTIINQISVNPSANASGMVVMCLPAQLTDIDMFETWAQSAQIAEQTNIVVGIAEQTLRLAELAQEMRQLNWVEENTFELSADPVAQKELRTRKAAITNLIENEIGQVLSLHRLSNGRWYRAGQRIPPNKNGISYLLSDVCDGVYSESPKIHNEIINRNAITSQGAGARRTLIEAMLTNSRRVALGIEGFPPERSLYESLLKAGKLHVENSDGEWYFAAPSEGDPLRLEPVWKALSERLFTQPPQIISVAELYQYLSAPPYGLTQGVFPILLCAFMEAHSGEITLYYGGSLITEPHVPDWEVLLRRFDLHSISGCRVTGERAAMINRFARGFKVEPNVMAVVRALVKGINNLSDYAKHTRQLPDAAKAVRQVVLAARSPEQLLFNDLPLALDCRPFEDQGSSPTETADFFERLNEALSALNYALPRLEARSRDLFLSACGLPSGEEGWQQFGAQAFELAQHVTHSGLMPILKRTVEAPNPKRALESVLAQIADRPLNTWNDIDEERFASQARFLGGLFQAEINQNPSETHLSDAQRMRSRQVVDRLRSLLQQEIAEDPNVVSAALQQLEKELTRISKADH